MSQPDTTNATHGFHPNGIAALAALAGVRDERPAWQDDALCAQTDPEAFFPEKGGSTREAKQVCNRCEVRTQCLEYALGHDERFGIWAALTERKRRIMRRGDRPAQDTPDPAARVVPAPREEAGGDRRESAPPPGRVAGRGMAATLPTEPRAHRARPQRPAFTFPARARAGDANPPDPAPNPALVRATPRPSTHRAAPPPRSRPAPRSALAGHPQAATPGHAVPDPPPRAPDPTISESPPNDASGGADTDRRRREAVEAVLSRQEGQPGAGDVDVAAVRALTCAIAAGSPAAGAPAAGVGPWPWRVAAVAAVLSGTVTRGQTARRLGERSQDVAHWVRRSLGVSSVRSRAASWLSQVIA